MNATGQSYKASLFNPDLGNEGIDGFIQIDSWKIRFQSGDLIEDFAVDRVIVEEAAGDRICFTDPDRPGLKVFTEDESVLEHRSLAALNQLRDEIVAAETRREIGRRLRLIGYCAIGCVLVIWFGSIATGLMIRSLVARVPVEWEEAFGKSVMEELQADGGFVEDTNVVARIEALAKPLLAAVPQGKSPVRFHVRYDPDPNAFALPGGHVVVNTGLLRIVDRPEQLLAVISHELAHVSEKHIARSMVSSAGPLVIFGVFLGGRGGVVGLLGAGSSLVIAQGFSQEYETEADDVGWKYLVAAKIDPRGMAETFEKFKKLEAEQKIVIDVPQALSSHPALDKRIARLEKKWRRLANKSGFLEFTNVLPQVNPDPARELPIRLPKRK